MRMLYIVSLVSIIFLPMMGNDDGTAELLALDLLLSNNSQQKGSLTQRQNSPRPPRPMTTRVRHRPSLGAGSNLSTRQPVQAQSSSSASEPKETQLAWPTESTSSSSSDSAAPDNTNHTDHNGEGSTRRNNTCFFNSIICAAGSSMCAVLAYVAYVGISATIEQQEASGSNGLG